MFTRILLLLLVFVSGVSSASLLSQKRLPAQYMQTTEDAAIWAQVGNNVINVGNVRAGQILAVVPAAADYYEFRFGFGTGFIDKGHLEPVQGKQRVEDGLGDLNKPLSNQNLVTWKDTLFITMPTTAAPFRYIKRKSSLSDPEQA
jgi:hypothetical protein